MMTNLICFSVLLYYYWYHSCFDTSSSNMSIIVLLLVPFIYSTLQFEALLFWRKNLQNRSFIFSFMTKICFSKIIPIQFEALLFWPTIFIITNQQGLGCFLIWTSELSSIVGSRRRKITRNCCQ